MTKKFILGVLIILVIYSGICIILSTFLNFSPVEINSLIYSGILTTVNIVSAFLITRFAINQKRQSSQKSFFSGTLTRFLTLIILITLIIKYLEISYLVFLLSLFLLYFTFQFWEILLLNRMLKQG